MLICKDFDNTVRWKEGERLHHLFEQRCDQLHAAESGPRDAVIVEDAVYTFRDVDNRANQVARYLMAQGLKAGDRVGLLFDKSVHTYVALLAVLKINAAYVPLDAGFPSERIAFILKDAGVKSIVSMSAFQGKLSQFNAKPIFLDAAAQEIDRQSTARLTERESAPVDQLAYIIYTSGTTGTPKGVAIHHPSICNFVRVAAEVYGMRPGDRCYQGMTIAFDFSVEELWVPLIAGAALVPGKPGTSLVGSDLADYLFEKRVTVLACVPTLLATIERDLPDLRILLVSGEACPHNLVVRWHRAGRTILNAYGPTEATVTATLTKLYPNKPVTIGGPLPTYTIVILDPDKSEEIEQGGLGEIGIAGIGLAEGYLNRPDLTQQKFIPDFLNIPNNPSKRIYRTGDLGRINDSGEVEFHGRIDTQVKVRGYRIELTEIESVLMQLPQIAQAVVDTYESEPGVVELVAYYSLKQGAPDLEPAEVSATLRKHLPGYMVPAYLERLPVIPMTPSNKADRKNLPPPKGPRFAAGSGNHVAPRNKTEEELARALAEVMKIDHVSVEDNFFQDLGAHSLLMARFCAEIRKRLNVTAVSMRDIYSNPTIARLAACIASVPAEASAARLRAPVHIPSDFAYISCGALQLLSYLAYSFFGIWVLMLGFDWFEAAIDNTAVAYLRIVAFAAAWFITFSAIPIIAKWTLIGRWKAEIIPVWSLRYFRFWLVRGLIRSAPMALFAGSPIYNLYLRLLGAEIGRGAFIGCRLPVCTDLISIGNNTVLRRDVLALGYAARSNNIHIGPVIVGNNAYVGDASVLDIDTVIDDDAQLGHASSLQSGQRIPRGKRFHGSPAQESGVEYCKVAGPDCTLLRRTIYALAQLIGALGVLAPVSVLVAYYVLWAVYEWTVADTATGADLTLKLLAASLVIFFGAMAIRLLSAAIVPRVLNRAIEPDKAYPLYGWHYAVARMISRFGNSPAFNVVFGDSSYIVYYLKWIGYRLNKVVQTGANFGLDQRHDNPLLCDIGSGTMVSDGLTMLNMSMSSTAFKISKVTIGEQNYFGNNIFYPAASKTGANCLLGTKVMVPIDGLVRENIGLLGSPCFEIPRVVERDKAAKLAIDAKTFQQQLSAKNRYNLVTILGVFAANWLLLFIMLLVGFSAFSLTDDHGVLFIFSLWALLSLLAIAWYGLIERTSLGFGSLTPQLVSMYDERFWRHERHWKFCGSPLMTLFKGTPFKNVISRILGVELGRKVFDDGALFYDKTLLAVGDHTTLNEGCVLQGHSLEEGVFKCDRVKIGSGCTLGAASFTHYGVTMGHDVTVDPDSFVMKGEIVDANSTWQGNPAKAIHVEPTEPRAGFGSKDAVLAPAVAAQ